MIVLSLKGEGSREFEIKKQIKAAAQLVLVAALGTGCSVTSLQCGVDRDSSYINLNTTPTTFPQNARSMAELCAFAYEAHNETT